MEARKGSQRQQVLQLMSQSFKISLLGAVILSVIFIINRIDLTDYFPIRTVRVYGINRIDKQEVQSLLSPMVSRGFFTINVEQIRDSLLAMPWMADLYVRRVWPDQVEITIVEKQPAARWNETSLLSDAGELFSPKATAYPTGLPQFVGPEGQQIVMLHYFKDINRLLSPLHAKISQLELTSFRAWKVTLDNGVVLQVGYKDILTRLEHFVRVYPKIVGSRAPDVDYIDLRYPNGVAVRWKAPQLLSKQQVVA